MALYYACMSGKLSTVQRLLSAGSIVDHKNKEGITALAFASSRGHADIVKSLLNAGANIGLIYTYDTLSELTSVLSSERCVCFN